MISNTITTDSGTEVYIHRILEITDDYISRLESPDDIRDANIFQGLLKEIYVQLFRATEPQRYDLKTTIDTSDIKQLDRIWDLFCAICYKYKHRPTLLRFATMIGISRQTFDDWKNGKNRGANTEYVDTIQKWLTEAESALEAGAIESNSIGSIFALKANFKWRETAPITEQPSDFGRPQSTPEQIAERWRDVKKPEIPVLEE